MKRWNLVFGLITCAMVLALASPALAGPITLRLESGGSSVTVADNGVGDLNSVVGAVTFAGSLGDFFLNVTTGVSSPVIGDPFTAMLDLNSIDVSMSAGGSLKVTLQNDDFAFPFVAPGGYGRATAEVGGVLSGLSGSSVSFQSWVNTGNLTPLPGSPTVIPAGSTPVFGALPRGIRTGRVRRDPISRFRAGTGSLLALLAGHHHDDRARLGELQRGADRGDSGARNARPVRFVPGPGRKAAAPAARGRDAGVVRPS